MAFKDGFGLSPDGEANERVWAMMLPHAERSRQMTDFNNVDCLSLVLAEIEESKTEESALLRQCQRQKNQRLVACTAAPMPPM